MFVSFFMLLYYLNFSLATSSLITGKPMKDLIRATVNQLNTSQSNLNIEFGKYIELNDKTNKLIREKGYVLPEEMELLKNFNGDSTKYENTKSKLKDFHNEILTSLNTKSFILRKCFYEVIFNNNMLVEIFLLPTSLMIQPSYTGNYNKYKKIYDEIVIQVRDLKNLYENRFLTIFTHSDCLYNTDYKPDQIIEQQFRNSCKNISEKLDYIIRENQLIIKSLPLQSIPVEEMFEAQLIRYEEELFSLPDFHNLSPRARLIIIYTEWYDKIVANAKKDVTYAMKNAHAEANEIRNINPLCIHYLTCFCSNYSLVTFLIEILKLKIVEKNDEIDPLIDEIMAPYMKAFDQEPLENCYAFIRDHIGLLFFNTILDIKYMNPIIMISEKPECKSRSRKWIFYGLLFFVVACAMCVCCVFLKKSKKDSKNLNIDI